MAIFHASTQPLSRGTGRSAVAAAAYRSGTELVDERTGLVHNYTKKTGIISAEIFTPNGFKVERNELWNSAEKAEKRKDARTAREWIVALPSELNSEQRKKLANTFGIKLSKRFGVAVDIAIHNPDNKGDHRNHHAHILTTTRQVTRNESGSLIFGEKATIELSDKARKKMGIGCAAEEITTIRQLWERITNEALEQAGHHERIDARSLKAQGIDREPTIHLGAVATEMERQGIPSSRGDDNRQVKINNRQSEKIKIEIINLLNIQRYRKEIEQEKHQEKALPLQSGETAEMAAERIKKGYFEEFKNQWRQSQAVQQAEKMTMYRQEAQTLHGLEPKKPFLFGVKNWERDYADWSRKLNEADRLATYHEFRGKSVLNGELDHASGQIQAWQELAQKRLEIEHPQLNQIATKEREKRLIEQKEWEKIDRAISTFKTIATKREWRSLEYRDSSKKWEALPDKLKTLIDNYNKLPKEARPVVLNRMRENFKNDPQGTQRLVQQIENTNDRGQQYGR